MFTLLRHFETEPAYEVWRSCAVRYGSAMQRFTDLKVWQRGHALVLDVYRLTTCFPSDEKFGLTSQMRRASVSVPANIAEGSRRRSRKDYAHMLNIAEGSLAELEYLFILGRDLGYLDADAASRHIAEATEISRMVYTLRRRVEGEDADSDDS